MIPLPGNKESKPAYINRCFTLPDIQTAYPELVKRYEVLNLIWTVAHRVLDEPTKTILLTELAK